jgi:hypothetical protein
MIERDCDMNEEPKPTIDERLEAIAQSLEILTHDVHAMQEAAAKREAEIARLDARERR